MDTTLAIPFRLKGFLAQILDSVAFWNLGL